MKYAEKISHLPKSKVLLTVSFRLYMEISSNWTNAIRLDEMI